MVTRFVCNDWFLLSMSVFIVCGLNVPQSIKPSLVVSPASPPVIGYTAVTHQFDVAALLLFLAYALWQMPHSWAIAIYRFDDYKNAEFLSCL